MREYLRSRGLWPRVLVALVAVACAVLLRLAFLGFVGSRTPFVTFYPLAMLAALYGGVVSGSITTALLGLLAYAWVLPQGEPPQLDSASWLALGVFVCSGMVFSAASEVLHRTRRRAAQAEAQAAVAAQGCELNATIRRLAAIVESSDDAIIGLTLEGVITSWNEGALRLYGYTAEETVGRHASMLCLPACTGEVDDLIAKIKAGERVKSFETQRRSKGGAVISVSMSLSAIRGEEGQLLGVSAVVRDVTERKRAEEALRESEQRLRFSQDIARMGQWELDVASGALTWWPGVYRIFEQDPEAFVPTFEAFLALVHPEDRDALSHAYLASVSAKTSYSAEHRVVLPGGRIKWVRESCRHVLDASGAVVRSMGIAQDITDIRRAEAALRESEAFARTILDTSPELMFLKDINLRYLAANAAHEPYLGLAVKDMLGRTDEELMDPELAEGCRATDLAALRQGTVLREEQAGGRWFRVSKKRVEGADGKPIGVAAYISDITESRRSFEALRQSEERFRQLVESAPEAIFVQANGRFAYVNQACVRLYGAEATGQLLGQTIVSRVDPVHHAQVRERIRQLNDEGHPVPGMEMRHLRLDGSPVDVEVSAVPLLYGGENGALVFLRDIGERKRVQALREDIERIARHDLKTPLNAVINLPLLLMGDHNLDPEQITSLQMIHEAGLRMLEQIDQSLTLYRIETGSFMLAPQAVDLAALLRQVSGDLNSLTRALGARLRIEAGLKPVLASGDPLLCRTMISNLLKNAVEASAHGEVVASLLEQDGQAVLAVHNAVAVPPELRKRFFDKYVSHGKAHGAGLGTYSARLSALAQKGSITLDTDDHSGTTVTVRLPLWQGRS